MMQSLLICLVAFLQLVLGAFQSDIYSNDGIEVTTSPQTSKSQRLAAFQSSETLPSAAIDTNLAASISDLVTRNEAGINSAQAGCWAKAPGDLKLIFSDRILAMTTFIAADDFPYDLSIEGAELYCTIPPDGSCDHCWRNTTTVQVNDAPQNSWCFFLFTNEYAGTGYESFYVHWWQGPTTLHNPGFIKIVMCHDEDESMRKRAIGSAQSGCSPDPNSLQLELGMGSNNFAVYVPADGQSHRMGQPNPELQCSNFGECKDCNDQADYVYLRNGPATSHCDMLFTESVDGGYIFSVSITREQYMIKLPQPGVLTFATCYLPGQRVENWISKLQKEQTIDIEVPVAENSVAVRSLSQRDDSAGCSGPQDDNHIQMVFGTDGIDGKGGYNFSTWVPIESIPYVLGQPTPQLHCQRVIGDRTRCGDCWSPLLWIYLPRAEKFSTCTVVVSDNLNGGGMLQIVINASPILYKLEREMNLLLVSCSPPGSASIEGSADTGAKSVENSNVVITKIAAARTDNSCGITDGSSHTKFTIHGGTGVSSDLDVKNDGKWYVFGDVSDADLLCKQGGDNFKYCSQCDYALDSMEMFGTLDTVCKVQFAPTPDSDVQFANKTWTLTGSLRVDFDIPGKYRGRVVCNNIPQELAQVARDVTPSAHSTSVEQPVQTVASGEGCQSFMSLGMLAPLALLPFAIL